MGQKYGQELMSSFMHALKKNILLHLPILAISDNYLIIMVDIIINCPIIIHFYFIICIRFSRFP